MTKIKQLKKPEIKKKSMNAIERFLWWKRLWFMTISIMITVLIVPLFAYYRGNIILGIRISILFYLFLIVSIRIANKVTKRADSKFLLNEGYETKDVKRWWYMPLKIGFIGLQIWVLFIMYKVWGMTEIG